jgi:cell division inhibitor SepF
MTDNVRVRLFRDDPPHLDDSPDWLTTTGPLSPFAENRRITTVTAVNYNDARLAGEAFRARTAVIVHLVDLDDDVARRVVDFCAGLVFGNHGKLERISPRVFLLTPHGMDVADEARAQLKVDGFLTD